ncbi:MAG: 50S ribosomal protein L6 [Rhodothermales bacterium]|nr:50S ribosomal protein L6 [Rhodothermales bacterium]
MSRIGFAPISVAENVTVDIGSNNFVTVKGPKGELTLQVNPDIVLSLEDSEVVVKRPTEQKRHKSMHGLYRSLIDNMVKGVSEGYKRELEIIGVGFRASVANDVLELALGFSHPIFFVPPEGIHLSVDTKRSKNTIVIIEGIDKQLVGQVAAKIRALRPPEPYKGKGVRYVGEYVRRKAGKTAGK